MVKSVWRFDNCYCAASKWEKEKFLKQNCCDAQMLLLALKWLRVLFKENNWKVCSLGFKFTTFRSSSERLANIKSKLCNASQKQCRASHTLIWVIINVCFKRPAEGVWESEHEQCCGLSEWFICALNNWAIYIFTKWEVPRTLYRIFAELLSSSSRNTAGILILSITVFSPHFACPFGY